MLKTITTEKKINMASELVSLTTSNDSREAVAQVNLGSGRVSFEKMGKTKAYNLNLKFHKTIQYVITNSLV